MSIELPMPVNAQVLKQRNFTIQANADIPVPAADEINNVLTFLKDDTHLIQWALGDLARDYLKYRLVNATDSTMDEAKAKAEVQKSMTMLTQRLAGSARVNDHEEMGKKLASNLFDAVDKRLEAAIKQSKRDMDIQMGG